MTKTTSTPHRRSSAFSSFQPYPSFHQTQPQVVIYTFAKKRSNHPILLHTYNNSVKKKMIQLTELQATVFLQTHRHNYKDHTKHPNDFHLLFEQVFFQETVQWVNLRVVAQERWQEQEERTRRRRRRRTHTHTHTHTRTHARTHARTHTHTHTHTHTPNTRRTLQ